MTAASSRWALLIAAQHGRSASAGMSAESRRKEVRQLLVRAGAIATPLRTMALIARKFEQDWRELASGLPGHNLIISPASDSPLTEVSAALSAIRARDNDCSVIMIPADHCAAVETAWVASATMAMRMAAEHQDTIYLLHDRPAINPLAFEASTDMCSSTVVVGTTDCLIELCRGSRPSRLVELSSLDQAAPEDPATSQITENTQSPINVIRIQSVEEYARFERGEYTPTRPRFIDVRA